LADEDVLSLIGRALFTRFLLDRNIVKGDDIAAIFSGAQRPEGSFLQHGHAGGHIPVARPDLQRRFAGVEYQGLPRLHGAIGAGCLDDLRRPL